MLDQKKMDEYLFVLRGILLKEDMRTMARTIFKSLGWVQILCMELEQKGYVLNPYTTTGKRKYHGRSLTKKGEDLLRRNNLLKGITHG